MHLHNASPSVCDCAGADFLRGVEVYRETVLEVVGDKPQKVEWPGYGFFIEVPEGAVPPGVTASVGVKVILAGQFKFPENSQLISAIYILGLIQRRVCKRSCCQYTALCSHPQ